MSRKIAIIGSAKLLLLLVSAGCTGIEPPRQIRDDIAFLETLGSGIFNDRILIAPAEQIFQPRPFPKPDEPTRAGKPNSDKESERILAYYEQPLDDNELNRLDLLLQDTLAFKFGNNVESFALTEGKEVLGQEELFREAESRGAQIVMTVKVSRNLVAYKGNDPYGQFWDTVLLLTFPPWNGAINDEIFEFTRRLEVTFFDVRDTVNPLHVASVEGRVERALDDFEHGFIFWNGLTGWFENPERFYGSNWTTLYKGLTPHVDVALQKSLLREVDFGLRTILQSPQIRVRLSRGDPATARMHTIIVGQNNGEAVKAEADARELDNLLMERSEIRAANAVRLIGDVNKSDLLAKIGALQTKSVDRVLFYFSGAGVERNGAQFLALSSGEFLSVDELAAAFSKVSAENVAFLLDTSFADAKRGQKRGGRSLEGGDESSDQSTYLQALADDERGRQVLCAAAPGKVTGELNGHGIMTGLILERLRKENSEVGLELLSARIEDRFVSRSEDNLGGLRYRLFSLPRESRKAFPLTVRVKKSNSAKSGKGTESSDVKTGEPEVVGESKEKSAQDSPSAPEGNRK